MLALSCAAFAQTPATGASERSREAAAVHSAVEEIVAAIARNDADGFDRLSTPDYTFVNPAGLVWTKAQYLGRIRSGDLKVESYTRDEENIREHRGRDLSLDAARHVQRPGAEQSAARYEYLRQRWRPMADRRATVDSDSDGEIAVGFTLAKVRASR